MGGQVAWGLPPAHWAAAGQTLHEGGRRRTSCVWSSSLVVCLCWALEGSELQTRPAVLTAPTFLERWGRGHRRQVVGDADARS